MRYLRTFDPPSALQTQRLLDCILWTEAMYCRVHRVPAVRRDGVVASIADYIPIGTLFAKA
jgi:hypothetical protein